MIKFNIKEKEYNLPTFMNIDNYVKIFKVKDLFEEEYFASKLIAIVTGAEHNDLINSDYEQIIYLSNYIMELLPKDKPKFIDRFEIDNIHYGFFPNWKELTFAEFMDMDTLLTKKSDELLDYLHILMAIMYRPITEQISEHQFKIEKYDVNSINDRAELFKKKLDIKYVISAQFFFINYAKRFLSYSLVFSTQTLSIWMKIKMLWRLRKILWKMAFRPSTVGSLSSTELLETILLNIN